MGEWFSNNILLPLMYLLVDIGLVCGFSILVIMLLDKLMDNKLINKIRKK